MSAANPYLSGDDDDDDLLADKGASNGPTQFGNSGGGSGLAPELAKALKDYIGAYLPGFMPDALSNMPLAFRAVSGMLDFFTDFTRFKVDGPLIWAMAEVLDELSNGKVRLLYQLHECERQIMSTHSIQRIMRRITEHPPKHIQEHQTEVSLYFEVFNDLINYTQDKATSLYYDLCEKLGREPDVVLVNEGFLSSRDTFARAAMLRPPAKSDSD